MFFLQVERKPVGMFVAESSGLVTVIRQVSLCFVSASISLLLCFLNCIELLPWFRVRTHNAWVGSSNPPRVTTDEENSKKTPYRIYIS